MLELQKRERAPPEAAPGPKWQRGRGEGGRKSREKLLVLLLVLLPALPARAAPAGAALGCSGLPPPPRPWGSAREGFGEARREMRHKMK